MRDFFDTSSERSLRIQKNIIITFLVRGASILISLILIPLTIDYINPVQYGVWLTISSIIAWINNFDLGMGNGLKNKLAHSIALNEHKNIRKYVSTTYLVLIVVALALFIIFSFIGAIYDWNKILNLPPSLSFDVKPVIVVVTTCFCIQFVLQTINPILTAIHQPFKSSIILFIGQLAVLVTVYFLVRNAPPNLFVLVLVLAGLPVIVLFFANIYFFQTKLKAFAPRIGAVDLKCARSLLNVGIKFFFIQISALVLYQTDNIIITQIMGPEAVTNFNVSYKLFQVLILVFSIILTPYWSAFTDAYAKRDFSWIEKSIKSMKLLWLFLSAISFLFFIFSDKIYDIWLGNSIVVSRSLSFAMALYVIVVTWHYIHVDFINGVGKIKLQLILIILCAIINVPLAVILCKNFGLPGVITANTISFAVMGVIFFIQSKKIISRTATGIWNS